MKDLSICFDRYALPGFRITTEDLCLKEDVLLPDDTIFKAGTKYFTYPDLKALLWHLKTTGQIPDSCDIPTDEECEQIIAAFATKDGFNHSFNLATSLGLGFYGSIGIISSIEEYQAAPQKFHANQAIGYGVSGNYWCHGTGDRSSKACALWLHASDAPSFVKGVINNGADIGYSVRLIQRTSPSRP